MLMKKGSVPPLPQAQDIPQMTQPIISEARLPGLAIGDLAFQKRLQFGQRAIELVGDAHHGAGFLDTRDRFVQNIDLGHFLQNTAGALCSTRPRREMPERPS